MYLDINVKRTKYSNGGNPIVQSKFMDVAHLDQRGTRVTFKLPVSKNITLSREIAKDRHSPSYTKNKLTFKKIGTMLTVFQPLLVKICLAHDLLMLPTLEDFKVFNGEINNGKPGL